MKSEATKHRFYAAWRTVTVSLLPFAPSERVLGIWADARADRNARYCTRFTLGELLVL